MDAQQKKNSFRQRFLWTMPYQAYLLAPLARPNDVRPTLIGGAKWERTLFGQTFSTPPGIRDIPAKFPGHPKSIEPKEKIFRGRERAFRPPTLCVEDPHPTRQSPSPKHLSLSLCSFSYLTHVLSSWPARPLAGIRCSGISRCPIYPYS